MIADQLCSRFVLQGGKRPLFEKSGAKTFFCWAMGVIGANAHGPAKQKFSAFFCSQKEAFLLACRSKFRFMPASPAGRLP
jgi:hypothetical protein